MSASSASTASDSPTRRPAATTAPRAGWPPPPGTAADLARDSRSSPTAPAWPRRSVARRDPDGRRAAAIGLARPEEPQLPSGQQQPDPADRQRLVVPLLHDQQQLAAARARKRNLERRRRRSRIRVLPRRPSERLEPVGPMTPVGRTLGTELDRSQEDLLRGIQRQDRLRQVLVRQRDQVEGAGSAAPPGELAQLAERLCETTPPPSSAPPAARARRESAAFCSSTIRTSAKLRSGPCECASTACIERQRHQLGRSFREPPLVAEVAGLEGAPRTDAAAGRPA